MKILLIDTGFSALPIYKFLRQCSDDIWVMGNRAEDVIVKHAEKRWIRQDYSDIFEVRRLVDKYKFDFVVPGCTDVSMDTCIKVTPDNPLRDSIRVNDILNRKSLFRAVCSEFHLPCPKIVNPASLPVKGKLICKPVDSFSGRGISIFDGEDVEQFKKAADIARLSSPSGDFVIENYVEGQLFSCSGFIQNRTLTDYFFVREGCSANPYAVDTSYVVDTFDQKAKNILISAITKLAQNLDLKDGLLHTQFILCDDGPMIVEMTRRCPGDLYSSLIERTTGFEYAAKYASYHLGKTFRATVKYNRPIIRHTVTANDFCIFDGLHMNNDMVLRAFYPLLNLGANLRPSQKDRVGILFCEPEGKAAISDAYDHFMKRDVYDVTYSELS